MFERFGEILAVHSIKVDSGRDGRWATCGGSFRMWAGSSSSSARPVRGRFGRGEGPKSVPSLLPICPRKEDVPLVRCAKQGADLYASGGMRCLTNGMNLTLWRAQPTCKLTNTTQAEDFENLMAGIALHRLELKHWLSFRSEFRSNGLSGVLVHKFVWRVSTWRLDDDDGLGSHPETSVDSLCRLNLPQGTVFKDDILSSPDILSYPMTVPRRRIRCRMNSRRRRNLLLWGDISRCGFA